LLSRDLMKLKEIYPYIASKNPFAQQIPESAIISDNAPSPGD